MDNSAYMLVDALKKGEALAAGGRLVAAHLSGKLFTSEWVESLMADDPSTTILPSITSRREQLRRTCAL